jgi:hypothetical protein
MGQSPAAFAYGRTFESNAAGPNGSWAPLLAALAAAGLHVGDGGVESFSTGDEARRSRRTRRRLARMLRGDLSVVLIAQAVLDFDFAGRTAHIRPDAVIIVPVDGRLVVVELKGFRSRTGHYPADKIAGALEQTAIYQLALRRILLEEGFDPALVSDEAVIVCAKNRSLQPVATVHRNGDRVTTLESRLAIAEANLAELRDPGPILAGLDTASAPDDRLAAFEQLVATYGTVYRPGCLAACGAALYCRDAAWDDPARLGATRLLGRAGSITNAVAWADGAVPADAGDQSVARRLSEVQALTAAAYADAGIALPVPVAPPTRRSRRVS